MIAAAKIHVPEDLGPKVKELANKAGLYAQVDNQGSLYCTGENVADVLIFDEAATLQNENTLAVNENTIGQIISILQAGRDIPVFDITAYTTEPVESARAFEAVGIPEWEGLFSDGFSGMVSIDTNF